MRTRAYTVYDLKVAAYLPPFFMRSNAEAIRAFQDAVNDRSTSFFKHPEDFILYCVGEFDDRTGVLTGAVQPEALGKAVEYLHGPRTFETPVGQAVERLSPRDRFEQEAG